MKQLIITVGGIVLVIALIVGGLTLVRYIGHEPSVILSSPCDPPCWYGFEPGQTNSWEIFESLTHLKSLHIESIMPEYDKNDTLVSYYWFFQRPIEDSIGSIYFENDRVTAISISTINSLTLADLFLRLGQPEEYWKERRYGENREYLDVFLLYPSKGFLAEVILDIEYNSNQVEIRDTNGVFRVTYFAPEMFQDLMGTKILFGHPVNAGEITLQTWSGYGTITFDKN